MPFIFWKHKIQPQNFDHHLPSIPFIRIPCGSPGKFLYLFSTSYKLQLCKNSWQVIIALALKRSYGANVKPRNLSMFCSRCFMDHKFQWPQEGLKWGHITYNRYLTHFVCKRFAVHTLLWLLEFLIHNNRWVRHWS